MYYPRSITILYDGKMVTAIDNKTGRQAISRSLPPYKELNDFEFVYKAATAIESLVEAQADKEEIKVGDRVQIIADKFDAAFVYQYATEFVDKLDIPNALKIRYCYSVSHPPLNDKYIVNAVSNNKAYIETLTGMGRCFVVDTKILKKVTE